MDTTISNIENEPQAAPTNTKGWYNSKTFKRFRRNPLALVGAIILIFYVVVAAFAPQLTAGRLGRSCIRDLQPNRDARATLEQDLVNPLNPIFWRAVIWSPASCFQVPRQSFVEVPTAPSREYPLGLTGGSYDIYYGIIWGARSAFYIGVLVTGISLALGIIIGGSAGFVGGWLDNILMRFTDTVYAFPNLILAMVFATIFGPSLQNVMIAIALVGWPSYARILRGDILRVRAQDFVDGARALGAKSPRLFWKHVLPNALGSLIVVASLDIGAVVLTAAALSFLGIGADIGFADWGQMINFARSWIQGPPGRPFAYWYVSFYPGLAIVLFVLGWNLLGDAFRDVNDPYSNN
ncbi:MAG: ABC transporter permease [Deinococcota bacterium]